MWQTLGRQRFYVRGDVLYWEAHGALTPEELGQMFAHRAAVQHQQGRVFMLIDARDTGAVPPETRRYAVQHKPDPPLRGLSVVIGAGLLVRTAVSLILAAGRLLGRHERTRMAFAVDEAEALKIIGRERRLLVGT